MEYLLFIFYLIVFSWLITRISFFKTTGISNSQLIIIFLFKVLAGIFYGWMGIYYGSLASMADTWSYHQSGLFEYHLLFSHPSEYFTNIFRNPYTSGWYDFFSSTDSYWNDLKANIFIKFLSVLDFFSFGHYYVNVIFHSFIVLIGPFALYRVMSDIYPGRQWLIIAATFFIPSFIYWASGIHKEGLIFTGLAWIIYTVYFYLKHRQINWLRLTGAVLSFLIVFILRNMVAILLLPALMAWIFAMRKQQKALMIFSVIYAACIIVFFTAKYISPSFDFPQSVVNKQQSFLQLQDGRSNVPITQIEAAPSSFLKNTPQAIALSMLRPYPSDVRHLLSLAAAAEIFILLSLLGILFVKRLKRLKPVDPAIYFCIFFAISMLLAIGFSNNNLGAISRYRSIVLPLVIIPITASINWKAIASLFQFGNKAA